jgi:hypothetical protein
MTLHESVHNDLPSDELRVRCNQLDGLTVMGTEGEAFGVVHKNEWWWGVQIDGGRKIDGDNAALRVLMHRRQRVPNARQTRVRNTNVFPAYLLSA